MAQLFSQGPRLSEPPVGDPAAQAIASLRGYAYQLYASGLAWLDLRPGQQLFLEVAQDYAVATQQALRAVQVKATTAKVTINSEEVREALDGFVDLVERNPSREVHLHYLSTCAIGREKSREHRANNEPTLAYWRRAAAGADPTPLRDVLKTIVLTDRVRRFVEARNDLELRDEFLRRIQWNCGQQPIESLQRELENALLNYHVERFQAAARRDQLAAAVVQRILDTITEGGRRRLTGDDLLALVTDTANVLVPRTSFEAALRSISEVLGEAQGQTTVEPVASARLLEPEQEFPLPPLLAERIDLTRDLLKRTRQNGTTFVVGGTGCGKTIVARLTARLESPPWCILDLRDNSAEQIALRLDYSLGALGASNYQGIILDDFNEVEDPGARRALARFLSALRRRDMVCLITSYRQPSTRAFSELGLDANALMAVPDLSLAEIAALTAAAGGEGDRWPKAVQRASAWGHPLCVQAIISRLRQRGWPAEERNSLLSFIPTSDLDTERQAARGRIIAILSEATCKLLYRVSILFGRFDRALALSLGDIKTAVPEPGVHLDKLIGPWVELTGQRDMRVSPLLQNAGAEILTPDETKRVHEVAAKHILGGRTVHIEKADLGFLHALLGGEGSLLLRLTYNIITTSPEKCRQLSEWMGALRNHRLDLKIFPSTPALSILLRLAQFLLVASNGSPTAIRTCWLTLQAELTEIGDAEANKHLQVMILARVLLKQEAIGYLPDAVGLILRLAALSQLDPELRAQFDKRWPSADGRTHDTVGALLITYALRIPSVPELQRAFDTLDNGTPQQRAMVLESLSNTPGDISYFVNGAWLKESKRQSPNWPAHLIAYGRMAMQAQSWGYRYLSIRCHIVRGIILDEYLDDPDGALRALDDAGEILGSDPSLDRARAKIFYRRRDHEAALHLFRQHSEKMELREPIARTYMLREAAISAAELEQFAEAREWFSAARQAAGGAISENMKLMAIGLRADEAIAAYLAGDVNTALKGLEAALDEIAPIDPASSITAGYRHRVIRHSILWLFSNATDTIVDVGGEPTAVMPGMCSNMEPPDLSELEIAPADYARYLLVQAEIASGASAGIEQRLRSHLGGKAIPTFEVLVRNTRMRTLARRLDAKGFVSSLPSWVESQIWVDANRDALQSDSQNIVYGEIRSAPGAQLSGDLAVLSANDALLSFGITAAVKRQLDALVVLFEERHKIPIGYAGKSILEVMLHGQSGDRELASLTAVEVYRVANNAVLTPDELFVACVRFVQWAKGSNFRKVLSSCLEEWARTAWARVIQDQQFLLRSPFSSVPAIREMLSSSTTGLGFLGRLIVSAEPAMLGRFDQTFRDYLLSL